MRSAADSGTDLGADGSAGVPPQTTKLEYLIQTEIPVIPFNSKYSA